jgi:hypothetical protein
MHKSHSTVTYNNITRNLGQRSNIERAHTFAEHLAKVFSRIPQKMNPKRKKHLHNFWRPLTNLNHQSTVSKELKFKKSSTA